MIWMIIANWCYCFHVLHKTHHPEHFDALLNKWMKFYPECNLTSSSSSNAPYIPPNSSTPSSLYNTLPRSAEGEGEEEGEEEEGDEESVLLNPPLSLSQIVSLSRAASAKAGGEAGRGGDNYTVPYRTVPVPAIGGLGSGGDLLNSDVNNSML
jgi:hypothetical protein